VIHHCVRHGPEVRSSSSHSWPSSGTAVGSDCSSGQNVKTQIAIRVGITLSKEDKADHITSTAKHLSTANCLHSTAQHCIALNMQNSNSSTRPRESKKQTNMASKNNSKTNPKDSLQPSRDASSLTRSEAHSNDAGGKRSSGYEVGDDTCKISAQQNNIMRRQSTMAIYRRQNLPKQQSHRRIKNLPNKSSETF